MKQILTSLLLILLPLMGSAQSLKIIFAGDLMGHMPQHNAAKMADGSYNYTPCFRYVADYVRNADLAIVNLEVPLAGKPYSGYPQFSAPESLAGDARDAGFDVMMTANNHCMDRGQRGLERTLRALDTLGIPHLGTYSDSAQHDAEHPMIVERNGFRIALLCYTYGTNGIEVKRPNVVNMIDTTMMARDLQVARERGAEYVITLIHWGIEYATRCNWDQETMAHWLLEHGSDAVIGGHPHVVQNFTLDAIPGNDRYPEIVVYSMGNLVSNQRDVNTDGGIMVELTLNRRYEMSPEGSPRQYIGQECRYMPYWVHRGTVDGLYQYYIVPSTDAVENPSEYQITGSDLKALQRFDRNTHKRLEACRLLNGQNIEERRIVKRKDHLSVCTSVVPLLNNNLLKDKMSNTR